MQVFEVEAVRPITAECGLIYDRMTVLGAQTADQAALLVFLGLPKGHWVGRARALSPEALPIVEDL